MKRILFIICSFVLLIITVFFIHIPQKKEMVIGASFNQTLNEIRLPQNWVKWHPEISREWQKDSVKCVIRTDSLNKNFEIHIPDQSFKIKNIDALTYEITEVKNNSTSHYIYVFTPAIKGDSTIALIAGKTRLIYSLLPFLKNNLNGAIAIEKLRSFMQDDNLYYGYPIKVEKVPDTVVATKSVVISDTDAIQTMHVLAGEIQEYIKSNNLVAENYTYIYFNSSKNDSLQLFVGIPVNKEAMVANGIECRKMPAESRIITAEFEGKFSEKQLIYQAVDRYIADKKFQKVALPFEKYDKNLLPDSDSSNIKIKIYFPVY